MIAIVSVLTPLTLGINDSRLSEWTKIHKYLWRHFLTECSGNAVHESSGTLLAYYIDLVSFELSSLKSSYTIRFAIGNFFDSMSEIRRRISAFLYPDKLLSILKEFCKVINFNKILYT